MTGARAAVSALVLLLVLAGCGLRPQPAAPAVEVTPGTASTVAPSGMDDDAVDELDAALAAATAAAEQVEQELRQDQEG